MAGCGVHFSYPLRFALYDEGFTYDDLVLEAGRVFTGPDADAQIAAWRFHAVVTVRGTVHDDREGGSDAELAADLWQRTAGLDADDRKALLLIAGVTEADVLSKGDAARAVRLAALRAKLETDPWLRLESVSSDWDPAFDDLLESGGDVLPSVASCAKGARGSAARRDAWPPELLRPRRVSLRHDTLGDKGPEALEKAHLRQTIVLRDPVSPIIGMVHFAMSGAWKRVAVPTDVGWCRNQISGTSRGNFGGCESYEEAYYTSGAPKMEPHDVGLTVKLVHPSGDSYVARADAIVVPEKQYFRDCETFDYWAGTVLGYRLVNQEGAIVGQEVWHDVSVDEALAGPDAYAYAPKRSKGRSSGHR